MTYRYRYQQRAAAGPGAQRGMYGGSFVRNADSQQAQIQSLMDQLSALTGITPGAGAGVGVDAGTGEPLTPSKPVAPAARGAVTPLTEKASTAAPAAAAPPPSAVGPAMPQLPAGAVIIGRTADGKWVVRMGNGSVGLLNPDGTIANVGAPSAPSGGTGAQAVTTPPPAAPAPVPLGTAGAPGFDASAPVAPLPQPGATGPAAPGDFVPAPGASSGYVPPVGGDPNAPAGAVGPTGPAGPAPSSLAAAAPQPIAPTPAPTTYPGEPTANPTPFTGTPNSTGSSSASSMPQIFQPTRPVQDVAPATSIPPPPDFSTVLSSLGAMPPPTPAMPPEYAVQLPPFVDQLLNPAASAGPR